MSDHCCDLNDAFVCNVCAALRKRIKKEWRAKFESPKAVIVPRNPYPKVCTMVGVHPSQVEETNAYLEKRGVAPNLLPSGDLLATSRKYLTQYANAVGLVNKSQ